jgi:malate dehydrogenase
MVDAILQDTNQIHSCAIMLDNDYGYSKIVSGVPVMIGAGGAEQVIEMALKPLQKTRFKNSVASVQEMVDALYARNFFDEEN